MSAAHWKLDNLIAIVDVNNQQADGPSTQIMAFEPLVDKLEAFGWYMQRIDGNDIDAVRGGLRRRQGPPRAQAPHDRLPTPAWAGACPFLEAREKNHFIRVEPHEWQLALDALDAGRQA